MEIEVVKALGSEGSHMTPDVEKHREDRVRGVLLGMALGDALGLPYEGLSRSRVQRWRGDGPLVHGFVAGRGMCSDDTEHACMVAQAMLAAGPNPDAFARSLAWRLRGWLAALPAGVGFATLRAICRLWMGFSPAKSGVFSAGNGPAMRAPLIGACWGHEPATMEALLLASTQLTHTDPKAYHGALVIARATYAGLQHSGDTFDALACWENLQASIEEPELRDLCAGIGAGLAAGTSCADFAAGLGLAKGVTGYTYHTVPVALYCWLQAPLSLEEALANAIDLGGDTDTIGAIVGAMVGAAVGDEALPQALIEGIWEWPRSMSWIRRLATRLSLAFGPGAVTTTTKKPLPLFWPGVLLRNVIFLVIVLGHGFRRLLPPYGKSS